MGPACVILLDTNVLSELTKPVVDHAVRTWANIQDFEALYTTVVNEAELHFGVAITPAGRRQDTLRLAVETLFATLLFNRVLPFDRQAAHAYSGWAAERRRIGCPVGIADLQIAAIARARGADAIATRNVRDFEGCGVAVIDPWRAT